MSSPRAATSVATSATNLPSRKCLSTVSRCFCEMSPCSACQNGQPPVTLLLRMGVQHKEDVRAHTPSCCNACCKAQQAKAFSSDCGGHRMRLNWQESLQTRPAPDALCYVHSFPHFTAV